MSSASIIFFQGKIFVATGEVAASALVARMQGAILSGEAQGIVIRSADTAAPFIEKINYIGLVDTFNAVTINSLGGNPTTPNTVTRDTLAGIFGAVGTTLMAPAGPAASISGGLVLDGIYKSVYDMLGQIDFYGTYLFLDDLIEKQRLATQGLERDFDQAVNADFREMRRWTAPKDPFVIDLDGDGIETTGINTASPILFDMNADGVRTGTAWIKSDDGILVLDRNGNGTIDSGLELFGDETILSRGARAGNRATDGFEAIADLDLNDDGVIDGNDVAYSQLRIWRDLNQDGISQANELTTLSEQGIASISTVGTPTQTTLPGGNIQVLSGQYTLNDGRIGGTGAAELTGSLLLGSNNYYSEFTTGPTISDSAKSLPDAPGSGMVRDLRSAISIDNSQSAVLEGLVESFAALANRDDQWLAIDALIDAWGDTTSMTSVIDVDRTSSAFLLDENGEIYESTQTAIESFASSYPNIYRKLVALERFNGEYAIPGLIQMYPVLHLNPFTGMNETLGYRWEVTLSPQQMVYMESAYEGLRQKVYANLVTQTRLSKYISASIIDLSSGEFSLDGAYTLELLLSEKSINPIGAYQDLVDLNLYAREDLASSGLDAMNLLRGWIEELPTSSAIRIELERIGVHTMLLDAPDTITPGLFLGSLSTENTIIGGFGNDSIAGGNFADYLEGGDGADFITGGVGADFLLGGKGNDHLLGGDGDDSLYGDAVLGGPGGNDILDGGAGNDYLVGGMGSDVYLFGVGDGQDVIDNRGDWEGLYETEEDAKVDALQFKPGIKASDVTVTRYGVDLIVSINGTLDKVTVTGFFSLGTEYHPKYRLDQIRFSNGVTWNVSDINMLVMAPTGGADLLYGLNGADNVIFGFDGDDQIYGFGGADSLFGGAGNDQIYAGAGDDFLDGSDGDDTLDGEDGDDTLQGGLGADLLFGGSGADILRGGMGDDRLYGESILGGQGGDDILDGGAGDDYLVGGGGSDTYVFGRGDGNDSINNLGSENDPTSDPATIDTLLFKDGVQASEVIVQRSGNNLIARIDGTDDSVTVSDFFYQEATTAFSLDQIKFSDATTWDIAEIKSRTLKATAGADFLTGGATADVISGHGGDDIIYGREGNDTLNGGEGDDQIEGGLGNDHLSGGAGNDYLAGDEGSDIYDFGRGDGFDTVAEWNPSGCDTNVLQFAPDITADQLWFRQLGYDLEVSVIGGADKVLVSSFYMGSWARINEFKSGDGKTLLDSQVDALVQAMSTFAPPAEGDITLPVAYSAALMPILTANWA